MIYTGAVPAFGGDVALSGRVNGFCFLLLGICFVIYLHIRVYESKQESLP